MNPMDPKQPFGNAMVRNIRNAGSTERGPIIAKFLGAASSGDSSRFDVILACLELREEEKITSEELVAHVPLVLDIWISVYTEAAPLQQSGPGIEWMLEDEYKDVRALAAVILDLLGYLPGETVGQALRDGLTLVDPRLKLFVVVSLLRRHEIVDPIELELVAASNEVRIILWEKLQELDMRSLMPERWATSEELASSDLIRWAANPMEIGYPPEEIELMNRFPVDIDDEQFEAYLFRFREFPKPSAPSQGWMAGIAGPYCDGERIGRPWSAFKAWDSMSPRDHFVKLFSTVSSCGD